MSEYPEHDKLRAVKDQSQAIGEFLDWLQDTKGVSLAHHETWEGYDNPQYVPFPYNTSPLLAEFFGIDYDELEREKRRMLDAIRAANG